MTDRTITITIRDGTIDVHENGRRAGGLGWDEMLGCVAELTHPKVGATRFAMLTDEEWADRRRIHEQRMAEIAASNNDIPVFLLKDAEGRN